MKNKQLMIGIVIGAVAVVLIMAVMGKFKTVRGRIAPVRVPMNMENQQELADSLRRNLNNPPPEIAGRGAVREDIKGQTPLPPQEISEARKRIEAGAAAKKVNPPSTGKSKAVLQKNSK
ncbi:MAG: hypothetical protein ABH857_03350 [Elusimicrobiota bacterium]